MTIIKRYFYCFILEFRNNFDKQSIENTTYAFEYDYDSIMHYGKFFFRWVVNYHHENGLKYTEVRLYGTSQKIYLPCMILLWSKIISIPISLYVVFIYLILPSSGKGRPTITPKKGKARLGQRRGLSKTDCLKINDLYGCLDKSTAQRRKYYNICNYMGL
jgi:hypothetical protein